MVCPQARVVGDFRSEVGKQTGQLSWDSSVRCSWGVIGVVSGGEVEDMSREGDTGGLILELDNGFETDTGGTEVKEWDRDRERASDRSGERTVSRNAFVSSSPLSVSEFKFPEAC